MKAGRIAKIVCLSIIVLANNYYQNKQKNFQNWLVHFSALKSLKIHSPPRRVKHN
jgi:hypothetical protein